MKKQLSREAVMLKQRRIELRLSQQETADKVGLLLQQYQRIENDTRHIAKANMILGLKICETLDIDPYKLVFGKSVGE